MTPRCAERTLELFCYADACRQRRTWRRLLQSAPVYACTGGCGSTREVHELGRRHILTGGPSAALIIRSIRAADYSFDIAEGRRDGQWNRNLPPVAAAPFCSCCGATVLVVRDQPVWRCVCDHFAPTCTICTRGACHCKCDRNPPEVN